MTTNNINVLIKPASGNCNCSCKYCFYADVSKNREQFSYGMMTQETLENIVKKALKYARTSCTFAFQGGEPTLVGIGFYKQLLEFEKKYNVNNARIFNSIQTNGLVIDDEWAEFFAKNNFLVGLSLDGGRDLHNYFRVGNDGKGTYDKVVRAADCFDRHNVEYNILAVVTGVAAGHGQKIIRDFCKKGFRYLQFIPCLEPFDSTETSNFTLTSEKFETFLKTTFDIYYDKFMKGNPISIRQFDNYINMILGMPPESCGMSGVCAVFE